MGRQANLKRLRRTLRRAVERDVAKEDVPRAAASALSPLSAPGQSAWDAQPAAKREAIEDLDGFAPLRNALRNVAKEKGEWAGIPIPIDGEQLVIEKSYQFAALADIKPKEKPEGDGPECTVRNVLWSTNYRCSVAIYDAPNGKVRCQPLVGTGNTLTMQLGTLNCADAWGIEQEGNAVHLLGTLLKHRQFKQYLTTGMFLETSVRSGISYLFRRLRPTVAITPHHPDGKLRILCAMCMHPIGYYQGTWAGAMCPTDDVIASLMMMRGDEHMFWKRCNQIQPHHREAGL